ncbi:MAG TPA: LacI family DNA-binding transcriptional regulator [bacterium]
MTTIYKIAQKARVSIGTVDRVIHERGRVSKATTEKVQRIIREFNYRPSVYARGLALSRTFCFGVLMPHPEQDGGYWALPEVGIKRALDELKVYGVRIRRFFYDKYSHDSFRKACRTVLDSKSTVDGLLIAPVLSEDAETFLRDIPPSLPYVFIDSYVPKARCLSFIGQNSFQSGVLSAKLMLLCVRSPGPVAVIRILPMDYHIEDRINGFRSHLQKYGVNPIVVYDADCRQGERIFQSVTQTILTEHPGLTGIFVPHASVGQVAQYLQEQGLTAKVHLIGYDLTQENRLHLQSGILDFVINQQPEMQGYRGIQALYRHTVLREEIAKESILPIDIVTRENLDSYSGAVV